MNDKKHLITVVRNQGTESQVATDIRTDGYLIVYLEGDKFKMEGNLEIKALTPILMKIAVDKFTKTN
jgi:spore maturation protein CgeB